MITSYTHLFGGKVQEWTNLKDNIKIEFAYSPEKPIIDTFTTLNFSIQNLHTGEHTEDLTARVVVTNGQRLFKFENITVPKGDFVPHQSPPSLSSSGDDMINIIIAISLIATVGLIVTLILKKR